MEGHERSCSWIFLAQISTPDLIWLERVTNWKRISSWLRTPHRILCYPNRIVMCQLLNSTDIHSVLSPRHKEVTRTWPLHSRGLQPSVLHHKPHLSLAALAYSLLIVSTVCPSTLVKPKKEAWSKSGAGLVTECSLSEELGDAAQILVLLPICRVTWDRIRSLPAFLPAVQIMLFFLTFGNLQASQ